MSRALPLLALVLAACEAGPPALGDTGLAPLGPCPPVDSPEVDIAQAGEDWSSWGDDMDLLCDIPPQGGAPYTPFHVRLFGVDGAYEGVRVRLEVEDLASGELLGAWDEPVRFTCANVGDNADHWVTSELHLRYWDLGLGELMGREVEVRVEVDDARGLRVESVGGGRLGADG